MTTNVSELIVDVRDKRLRRKNYNRGVVDYLALKLDGEILVTNILSLPCRPRAQSVLEQKGRQGLTRAGPIILHGHRPSSLSPAGIRRFPLAVTGLRPAQTARSR